MLWISIYGILCLIGFGLMGYDKYLSIRFAAKGKGKRISEKTLLIWACLGGIGVWIGMYMFHHKTLKKKFYIGVPILCMLTLLLYNWLFQYIL